MTDPKPLTLEELDRFEVNPAPDELGEFLFRLKHQSRRCITLESELAQLRREKAEREVRDAKLAAWLRSTCLAEAAIGISEEGQCYWVRLEPGSTRPNYFGEGPTYEAALAAALKAIDEARK